MSSDVVLSSCTVTSEVVRSHNFLAALAACVSARVVASISRWGWCVCFALTSGSLRFFGCLNATSGGLGTACFSLEEVWRIGRYFLTILARW